MNSSLFRLLVPLCVLSFTASAATYYVDLKCATPTPPYTNWTTAATNIQDAVDVAANGDEVVVNDGVYATGGRLSTMSMTNRLSIYRRITLRSVNGPEHTVIQGYQLPGVTNGTGAIRCVAIFSSAVLSGFTLTGGATTTNTSTPEPCSGGGIYCSTDSMVSNCVFVGNAAAKNGGGAYYATLQNCVFTNNWAPWGGGAAKSIVHNCRINGNSADSGGGVYDCSVVGCELTGNIAKHGGGAYLGYVSSSTVTGNSAKFGGGVVSSSLSYSIIYFNTARADSENVYLPGIMNLCCTTPIATTNTGNLFVDPQLASASHLSANSPCRGAANFSRATGLDLDGETWCKPPSIGCDEYIAGSVTGALYVAIGVLYSNVTVGFAVDFTAMIDGRPSASVWDFGGGITVSNRPYVTHAWNAPGDYPVLLRAYNETYPDGVSATVTVHVQEPPVHYVDAAATNSVPPYSSWETAAGDIQSAVDAATSVGALILVADGVYASGGRAVFGTMTNRVVVDKPVVVQSANGPANALIVGAKPATGNYGDGAIRCVWLGEGAVLSGLTLTNGATRRAGDADYEDYAGAVWCRTTSPLLTNCLLVGNSAGWNGGAVCGGTLVNCVLRSNTAYAVGIGGGGGASYYSLLKGCVLAGNNTPKTGGGAYGGTLTNCSLFVNTGVQGGGGAVSAVLEGCVIATNTANYGGGAASCTLRLCEVQSNSASYGGGTSSGTLNNCTLSNNSATNWGGGAYLGTLNNCTLVQNSGGSGGGAYGATLNNCTAVNNTGTQGGGTYQCTNNNCIIYFNQATTAGTTNWSSGLLRYSCTTPLAPGPGNFSNDPALAHLAGGDYHLQSNSPCINAGSQAYVATTIDLDGNPRVVGGTVDVGAYEFQFPSSLISYAWLQQWGLPTDGSADSLDPDADGLSNWQEWMADTEPTNSASALRMLTPVATNLPSVTLSWLSSSNRLYSLERAINTAAGPLFTCIASNIPGRFPTASLADSNAPTPGPALYRVAVQPH